MTEPTEAPKSTQVPTNIQVPTNTQLPTSAGVPMRRSRWLAVAVGVLGGVALLGTIGAAAVAGVGAAAMIADTSDKPQLLTEAAEGVTKLEVDASFAGFVVSCDRASADPDAFTLSTKNGSRQWQMTRRGDTLRIEPVEPFFYEYSVSGPGTSSLQSVFLALPERACSGESALIAELSTSAGELDVDGVFAVLDLEVGGGMVRVNASATEVDAEISLGKADLNLGDVRNADLSVDGGDLRGDFVGIAPSRLDIEVNLGSAELRLPDEVYAVRSENAFGDFKNTLRTDPAVTEHVIEAEVSGGELRLRPGGEAG